MTKTALFVQHQARPGQRDEVRRVWEKYVKPRAAANPAHEQYFFCFDSKDTDAICVFQLYTSETAMQEFLQGDWYADYLKEVAQFVAVPPQITPANLVWAKSPAPQ
jgi:quinol monooxygenase YgiN